jgi:signal transduction histidine kinase
VSVENDVLIVNRAAPLSGWRVFAVAGLIVAAAIAVFWAVVTLGERAARPDGFSALPEIEFTAFDAQDQPLWGGKKMQARQEDPYEYVSRITDRIAVNAVYEGKLTALRNRNYSLFLSRRADLLEVRLNGTIILADVRSARLNGSFVAEPALFELPTSLLREGENRFTIKIKRSLRGPFIFPDFAVGPTSELVQAHTIRHLMSVEISIIGIVIMAFTALLAVVVVWPEQDRRRNIWFVAMLATSALGSITFMFSAADKYDGFWLAATSLVVVALSLSSLLYALNDMPHGRIINGRNMMLSVVALTGLALWIAIANYRGINPQYYLFIFMITCRLLSVGLGVLAMALLAYETARSGGVRWVERFILIVWMIATAFDRGNPGLFAVYSPFVPDLPLSLQWTPILGSLTGLAMVASLAKQASEARATVVTANARLTEMLDRREDELVRSYEAQKQMLHRQVMLEERQRIVRDMHDGIGGQLLGLMMQVRSGGVEKKQVEEGLQSSLADLRLIVDSMDTAEDGLAETLRSFEHRVRAQVEAAGIAFKVDHGLDDGKPGPGPRPTLQILRILQEAVTNAMRHSGATEIALASHEEADGQICISISDNGKGLPAEIKGGRGLTSMRSRAQTVGGMLDIISSANGTTLRLTLPLAT